MGNLKKKKNAPTDIYEIRITEIFKLIHTLYYLVRVFSVLLNSLYFVCCRVVDGSVILCLFRTS